MSGETKDMRSQRNKKRNLKHISTLVLIIIIIMMIFACITSWKILMKSEEPLAVEYRSQEPTNPITFIGENGESIKTTKPTTTSEAQVIIGSKGYTIPGCHCIRFGLDVENIKAAIADAKRLPNLYPPKFLEKYDFEGHSTCSDYSTQRGANQSVVTYSYYHTEGQVDLDSQHFKKYLGQLHGKAKVIRESYPEWNMRIYHNITEDDKEGNKFLCHIYCSYQHVDLCQVHSLPVIGDLVKRDIVGRLWRFAVMGDPTVSMFMSRDSDSWILDREVTVIKEWLSSGKGFHVIRDHPNHKAVMLAGLWGGTNKNMKLMRSLRDDMFSQPLNLTLKFDQYMLATKVWPHIKNDVIQYDSYNCLQKGHEGSLPFPVRRVDGLYCGWGPFKFQERKKIFETNCPLLCRPTDHRSWTFC